MSIKTYRQLIRLPSFEERFDFLKIGGRIGKETFGFDRYLNQTLYQSREWKQIRDKVIIRDDGCDLGIPDRGIFGTIYVHHIVPITIEDLESGADCVLDLNNLISTSHKTHNAIHFANENLLARLPTVRMKGDTCLWNPS